MHKDFYHGGKKLVSATTLPGIVVKEFLDRWKKDLCECVVCQNELDSYGRHRKGSSGKCGTLLAKKVADDAADLSNIVHAEVAEWLEKGTLTEEANEWTKKIVAKLKEGNTEAVLLKPETTLRCDEALLSGSPDGVCKGFDRLFILDHKVKKNLDVLTGVQGYIYRLLIKNEVGQDIRWMLLAWGQVKTGNVKLVWIDLNKWRAVTKALIIVWNAINPARQIKLRGLK